MTHYITEITILNALDMLSTGGFNSKKHWSTLGGILEIPQTEKKQLWKLLTKEPGVDSDDILQQILDWWITNKQPSWETLISSVERCGDTKTADYLREQLQQGKVWGQEGICNSRMAKLL